MNAIERRVLDAIDRDALLATLCDLIEIRSLVGSESAAQAFMAQEMTRAGMTVDQWNLDFETLRRHPSFSMEVERLEGIGIVGALGRGEGGTLIFNGHVDVVPSGDEANWSVPPWRGTIKDGRVYGRGALDMKGGLICGLFAGRAIRDAAVTLNGRLLLESVIGEEDGGVGTLATVLRGYRGDGAIVMEPTQLMVAPAQAGALNFRITVPGRAAHGCFRPEGVSAIEKFIPLYQAVMEFEAKRNQTVVGPLFTDYEVPYAITIGTVQAGNWASTVAETLTCEGRFGIAVGEDILEARQTFEEVVARAAHVDPWLREHPPVVTWWGGQFAPAAISAEHPLVGIVGGAYVEATGEEAHIRGMPYGADMRLLVNEGRTPTLLFGPGDVRVAHQPDEFVPIRDLLAATRTLALVALRFCGYRES